MKQIEDRRGVGLSLFSPLELAFCAVLMAFSFALPWLFLAVARALVGDR